MIRQSETTIGMINYTPKKKSPVVTNLKTVILLLVTYALALLPLGSNYFLTLNLYFSGTE